MKAMLKGHVIAESDDVVECDAWFAFLRSQWGASTANRCRGPDD
jgi:hypothetical protein